MTTLTRLRVGPDESGNQDFGKLMESLRLRARISRGAAAQLLGLTSEYIRLIEKGKRTPAEGQMWYMLEIYNVEYKQDGRCVIFENHEIEFTSRIREARMATGVKVPVPRNEQIGRIVILMGLADDETLRHVHAELLARTLK